MHNTLYSDTEKKEIIKSILGENHNAVGKNFPIFSELMNSLGTIRKLLMDLVGIEYTPQFSELTTELNSARVVLEKVLLKRGISNAKQKITNRDNSENDISQLRDSGNNNMSEIKSRNDVIQMLDKICDYYTRYEPSSPIPLLLQRA